MPGELVSLAKLDRAQADDLHHRAAARQRSVVDEPHPAAGGAARDRSRVSRLPQEGERRPASGREPRRRGDGLRAAEADADAHAARGPLQRARHGRRARRSGCPIRCCRNRWCAAACGSDWLPDIYLNPHGYPSHEWVQQFAGYVPPGFRVYWSTRGWYTQRRAGCAIRAIPEHADAVAAHPRGDRPRDQQQRRTSATMNLRHQARYRRWAYGFAPYVFNQEIYKDTAIYYTDPESGQPRGSAARRRAAGGGEGGGRPRPMSRVAAGDVLSRHDRSRPTKRRRAQWLDLVTKPGFAYLMAHHPVSARRRATRRADRRRTASATARSATLLRVRPVRPAEPTAHDDTRYA